MIQKIQERERAIILRKKGYSYSEILKRIPVAKSTLSLWLRSVGLSKKQKQRLTEKKLAAALRGAKVKRNYRLTITKEIIERAKNEIGRLSGRELWLIGIALYWAEGAKQKENNISQGVKFNNSDPAMIKVFVRWLRNACKIVDSDINFRIALHESARHRLKEIQEYWANITGFSISNFQKIDWKKHRINTNRKNVGKKYFGVLSIYVRKSTNLNRKIKGWIEGIYEFIK